MSDAASGKVHEFRTTRRVEFADTDLSGLVHFARFFVFMETAEHQFIDSLGTSVHVTRDGEEIGWPRVSASCDYLSPIRYGDLVEIRVKVLRKGVKSLTWGFWFSCAGRAVARGRVTAVCCVVNDPAGLRAVEVPPAIADRITVAPDDDLEEASA